jgi:hypothetical protein
LCIVILPLVRIATATRHANKTRLHALRCGSFKRDVGSTTSGYRAIRRKRASAESDDVLPGSVAHPSRRKRLADTNSLNRHNLVTTADGGFTLLRPFAVVHEMSGEKDPIPENSSVQNTGFAAF